MPKRLRAPEVNLLLRGPESRERNLALRSLPEDVDVELAVKVLLEQVKDPRRAWSFARSYKKLPVAVIRGLLSRLEEVTNPVSIFIRVYVAGEADVADAWERAMFRLLSLDTTYAWGSKQKRSKLEGLAAERRVVEAVQASVVNSELARMDALAVLAIEASEASVDALMPHYERAAREKDFALDRLQNLKKYASKTPAMVQMTARVDAMVGERNAASPALDFAAAIGLGTMTKFWFDQFLASDLLGRNGVPMYQGALHLDSGQLHWFSVNLSKPNPGQPDQIIQTRFGTKGNASDGLGIGLCTSEELPTWLAAAGKKLKCGWDFAYGAPRTNLRGAKRERMTQWLQGLEG